MKTEKIARSERARMRIKSNFPFRGNKIGIKNISLPPRGRPFHIGRAINPETKLAILRRVGNKNKAGKRRK